MLVFFIQNIYLFCLVCFISNAVHFILLYHHFRFFLLSDSYNLFAYAHETACNTDVFKIVSIQSFIYLPLCLIRYYQKSLLQIIY